MGILEIVTAIKAQSAEALAVEKQILAELQTHTALLKRVADGVAPEEHVTGITAQPGQPVVRQG